MSLANKYIEKCFGDYCKSSFVKELRESDEVVFHLGQDILFKDGSSWKVDSYAVSTVMYEPKVDNLKFNCNSV